MREYLTAEDICNELSMERTVYDGAFLIVEGITDSRLFGKFIDDVGTRIRIAHSKDNVRGIVREMSGRRGDDKVLGITDPDLDLLRGRRAKPPLFHTDCRDMEMMALRSNALNDVISEYGEKEKVERFEETVGPILDTIVSSSYPIGLLMSISHDHGLNLSFKNLDFHRFINQRTLGLDVVQMVSEVLDNSRNIRVSRKELVRVLSQEAERLDDIWKAARGHDTISILLIGLRKTFGGFNAQDLQEGELGGALRLAFSDADFRETALYRDTGEWASRNGVSLWDLTRPGNLSS